MSQLAIIGSGSWGTALAMVLAPRFEQVKLWAHEADLVAEMRSTRINSVYHLLDFCSPRTSSRLIRSRTPWSGQILFLA